MEEENKEKINLKDRVFSIIKKNKIKILSILFLIFIFVAFLIFFQFNQKKKNNLISEEFMKASLMVSSNEIIQSKEILEKIVFSKNKFYSGLALNLILEKDLEKDFNKIISYFNSVEKLNLNKNQKDLLIFKKALFLLKNSKVEEGEKLLDKIANSDSNIKNLAKNLLKK